MLLSHVAKYVLLFFFVCIENLFPVWSNVWRCIAAKNWKQRKIMTRRYSTDLIEHWIWQLYYIYLSLTPFLKVWSLHTVSITRSVLGTEYFKYRRIRNLNRMIKPLLYGHLHARASINQQILIQNNLAVCHKRMVCRALDLSGFRLSSHSNAFECSHAKTFAKSIINLR